MPANRKQWVKPQLVILGRGTPEENVLTACKSNTIHGPESDGFSCAFTRLTSSGVNCCNALCNS
jgi:hypothetical protein